MIQHLYYWLAICVSAGVFWALPLQIRYGFLALVSFALVLTFDAYTALAMLVISSGVYGLTGPFARDRLKRRTTKIAIGVVVAYLGYFKYLPAMAAAFVDGYDFQALLLPIGISYFSFKLIHYTIERGRNLLPDHSIQDFFSYIFLVPIFTAGPIQRFDLFVSQRVLQWENEHLWIGLTRIAHGLIKKFVIGALIFNMISQVNLGGVDVMLSQLEDISPLRVGLFLVLSYLYVYMDFSGYTDIAIGTSRLFGVKIVENFNFPVFAPNIGNLWKRWHMSLANWCQSYIYMPVLGWSRNPYTAVFSSFLVMGLWHAASLNWVAWGLYNAFGVAIYQKWSMTARRRKWKIVKTMPYKMLGYPLTFFYFAGSFAFTTTDHVSGVWGAIRLLAKCLFIDLPA